MVTAMTFRLLALAVAVLAGCSGAGEDLPPVGTQWQECDAAGNHCVTHEVGVRVHCDIVGSTLGPEFDPLLPSITDFCFYSDVPIEIHEDPSAICATGEPGVLAEGCSVSCDLTGESCVIADE